MMVAIPTPHVEGKAFKIKYITQVKSRPPTFALFCTSNTIPSFTERFLRSRLQSDFSFHGVPIRFIIKKKITPDAFKKKNETYEEKKLRRKKASRNTIAYKNKNEVSNILREVSK